MRIRQSPTNDAPWAAYIWSSTASDAAGTPGALQLAQFDVQICH
jgi:hypothetical protein